MATPSARIRRWGSGFKQRLERAGIGSCFRRRRGGRKSSHGGRRGKFQHHPRWRTGREFPSPAIDRPRPNNDQGGPSRAWRSAKYPTDLSNACLGRRRIRQRSWKPLRRLLHDSNRINRDSSLSAIGTAARLSSSGFYSCRFDRWRHWRWSFGLRRNFKRSRRNDGFESGKSSARFRQPGFTRASSHYPDPPRRRPATGRGYRCDRGRRDCNSSPRRFRFRPAFRRWIHQPRRGIFSTGAPFRRSNL